MIGPIRSISQPRLVLDGADAEILKDKTVVILDDVITSGKTLSTVEELMRLCKAKVSAKVAVLKQECPSALSKEIIYLHTLPVFPS